MAFIGEVIYEDYLYKFTGKSRSILWGKGNPWRQKFFSIKRIGSKPVLEIFNKKPKNRNSVPKGKVELWPSFRVEKVTNMKNRAYVFQITTPDTTICLSTDEQRSLDIFVFFLQIQMRLKDQIQDDYYSVHPENSEALRRIGAKSTECILHVSPYGITLALQSNRSVLAQWPLKSIRSYESSERGQLSIEAGRVAPMGDGLYIFNTEIGNDNILYDLIDRYVLDALEQVQPGNRGGSEEIEDYVVEAERLHNLTIISACTADTPDIRRILQENWCTDIPNQGDSPSRPRQISHSRLTHSSSMGSLNSQNSASTARSVPARMMHDVMSPAHRGSPRVPRSLPAYQTHQTLNGAQGLNHSHTNVNDRQMNLNDRHMSPGDRHMGPNDRHMSPNDRLMGPNDRHIGPNDRLMGPNDRHMNLNDRPPPPLPATATIPIKSNQSGIGASNTGEYLKMDASSSFSRSESGPGSPFSPSSADWSAPPSFRDAMMRQKSTSPIPESETYNPGSYLHPASDLSTSTPIPKAGNHPIAKDQYLTPLSFSEENGNVTANSDVRLRENHPHRFVKHKSGSPKVKKVQNEGNIDTPNKEIAKARFRRLRSISCEDLSDYLRNVVYDPVSKSMNDLLADDDEYILQEPFPRLQTFSGVIERSHHGGENYYNIEGLRGKIYDGPGLTVAEIRKRFSKRSQSRIRRSVSNPSFIGSPSMDKLNIARVSIGLMASKTESDRHSSTIIDILPESLKRHLNKDGHHKGSHGTLSVSSKNSSKHSSRGSSRAGSAQTSPYNSLARKGHSVSKEDIVATTSVKGITITKRSRSFRRQKPVNSDHNPDLENQSAEIKGDHSQPTQQVQQKGDNHEIPKQNELSNLASGSISQGRLLEHEIGMKALDSKVTVNGQKRGPKVFRKPKPAEKTLSALNDDTVLHRDSTV